MCDMRQPLSHIVAIYATPLQPYYRECVSLYVCVCIKARSRRYGRQLLFLTKHNGGRTSFELRCTYEPHPPAQAGRMVRPHLYTSPLLLTHSFHLISSLLFFLPLPCQRTAENLTALAANHDALPEDEKRDFSK